MVITKETAQEHFKKKEEKEEEKNKLLATEKEEGIEENIEIKEIQKKQDREEDRESDDDEVLIDLPPIASLNSVNENDDEERGKTGVNSNEKLLDLTTKENREDKIRGRKTESTIINFLDEKELGEENKIHLGNE